MSQDTQTPARREPLAAVCAAQRVQPYRFIHKALRVMMFHTLQRSGTLDASEPRERAAVVEEVERLLAFCADHLAHENHFLLAPLRERAPRAVLAFEHDHQDHLDTIAALRLLLARLRDAGEHDAQALAYELHLRLSDFVADNLPHMVEEETTQTQALWEHFSDAELAGLLDALHASLSPQENLTCLQWMARGLNHHELVMVLADLRQHASAAAFAGMADVVRQNLPTQRWARLARALGLPPLPGLGSC